MGSKKGFYASFGQSQRKALEAVFRAAVCWVNHGVQLVFSQLAQMFNSGTLASRRTSRNCQTLSSTTLKPGQKTVKGSPTIPLRLRRASLHSLEVRQKTLSLWPSARHSPAVVCALALVAPHCTPQ